MDLGYEEKKIVQNYPHVSNLGDWENGMTIISGVLENGLRKRKKEKRKEGS